MTQRFSIALLLVGVVGAASVAEAAASGWSIQHTPDHTGSMDSELLGVSCASGSACTAVGYYETTTEVTLAERWNGTKWTIQHTLNPTGATAIYLKGVSCTAKSACTAVGEYHNATTDVTLAERWNGTKWKIQTSPTPAGAVDTTVKGVSCSSRSACTAVGDYYNGTVIVTLAERWNGTKWKIQHTFNPAGGKNIDLNATDPNAGR